jgi:predicted transcriptional regulator
MQVDSPAGRRVALMSIHPGYAEAIVSGSKRAEFRKRPLAPDVDVVLVYATAPVSAIIGWFTVCGTVKASPKEIWRLLHDVGGIGWTDFSAYYSGCAEGIAFLVGESGRLSNPVRLAEINPSPATPQSFNYISGNILPQIAATHEHGEREVLASRA